MRALPLGVPKLMISTLASGQVAPFVGTKDVLMMHSVVDILGLNRIACTIFDNVAAALKGMMDHGHGLPKPDPDKHYVAITMLGNTTTAVMAAMSSGFFSSTCCRSRTASSNFFCVR